MRRKKYIPKEMALAEKRTGLLSCEKSRGKRGNFYGREKTQNRIGGTVRSRKTGLVFFNTGKRRPGGKTLKPLENLFGRKQMRGE